MTVIKCIKVELLVFALLLINVLISINFDIGFYTFFEKVNYGSGALYLKNFFIKITELGDSMWYFLIFIIIYIFSIFVEKLQTKNKKFFSLLKYFSLSGFVYLLFAGTITQVLKHIIGRPRPNYINFTEGLGLDFFTTNSNLHSFPSGHASTAFMIALLMSALFPKLKIFFYIFSFLIAISRVVVGAHYITDVVAGILVAIIAFKILNNFFDKKFSHLKLRPVNEKIITAPVYSLIVFGVFGLLLSVGSDFDLYFSNLFYYGDRQFFLQSYYVTTVFFREILLPGILIYICLLPIISKFFPIKFLFFNYDFSIKNILFIWSSSFFSLILVVNILLKNLWGRARPNDIQNLGGENHFTSWHKISDSCSTNCSFVSGDASVGFFLIVLFFITKKNTYFYLALFFGIALGVIRIAEGGHFLSDVVFANIFVIASVGLMFFYYRKFYDK